jgi:hypothetical protein
VVEKVLELKAQVQATKIDMNAEPCLDILCQSGYEVYSTITSFSQYDLPKRMLATAEIFRIATEIYVHRIAFSQDFDDSNEVPNLVQTALHLLTSVPDAQGPGANLGWCLVVIGSEIDSPEQRDYIRSRLRGLHQLGINNSKSAEKILEQVWLHRDLYNSGLALSSSWQDVMQEIGEQQILV